MKNTATFPAPMPTPTTTVTIAAAITSTRFVEAVAECPYCKQEMRFEFINDQLKKKVECSHYLGRVIMSGNAVGFKFGEVAG